MSDAQPRAPWLRGWSSAAFALLLALMTVPPTARAGEEGVSYEEPLPGYVIAGVGTAGLPLRFAPGMDQPVLGTLPEGTGVTIVTGPVVGSDGTGDWYQVELGGAGTLSGYTRAVYLVEVSGATSHEPASPEAPALLALPEGSWTYPNAIVTGYANGSDGGAVGSITASGTQTRWGVVAADRSLFPFGTMLLIEGFEDTVFVVEDTGSGVKGVFFDVWFPDVPTAAGFGLQRRAVTVLPPGS